MRDDRDPRDDRDFRDSGTLETTRVTLESDAGFELARSIKEYQSIIS